MRWDAVIPAVITAIEADADVQAVLGATPALFMAGEREFKVSSCRYTIISDVESENYEDTLVQFDFWVRSTDQLKTLAAALRRLLHHEIEVTIGGAKLWSKFAGQRPLTGATDGTFAHSLDFQLTYLRGMYAS